jgi:outer membrane protein assembly factor BamB
MMRKLVGSVVAGAVLVGMAAVRVDAAPATCAVTSVVERCEAWADRSGVPVNGQNTSKSVAVTPDGSRTVTAGYTAGSSGGFDFLVVSNDAATGLRRWQATYDGGVPGGGNDLALDLAMSPDGSKVFVTGQSEREIGNSDYVTVAFDVTTGARLWVARLNGPANSTDVPSAIAASPDGSRVYVTGYSQIGVHPSAQVPIYAATTVAYSAGTGTQLWQATYQGPAAYWDIPKDVVATATRVVITARSNGASTSNNDTDDATVAYDAATGARAWASRYDSGSRDYPYALATSPDGKRVYATAERAGFSSDYVTLAYDSTSGALAWATTYASLNGTTEIPVSVAVSPSGDKLFVTGFGFNGSGPTDRSILTIAYSSAGQELWVSRHTAPGGEAGSRVAVSPDGRRVYVAGLAVGQAVGAGVSLIGSSYVNLQAPVTVAYDATNGAVAWSAHFGSQGSGNDVAVSPDSSRVFVAAGDSEAITVAYDR